MKIFKDIKNSVYSPEYYNTVKQQSFGQSIKYLAKVVLVPTLLFTVIATIFVFSAVSTLRSDKDAKGILDYYPAELEVKIKSGQVSTNVTEPYMIPLTGDVSSSTKNAVVIDTNVAPDIEKFEAYNTQVLITKEYIIYKEDTGKISIQSTKDIPDIVINRDTISGLIDKLFKYLPLLVPILAVFIFLGIFIAYMVANLFFVLILSLVTWVIQKIRKDAMSYSSLVKVGIHAVTLPILLEVVFLLIGINLPIYVSMLVFIVIVFMNLKKVSNITNN